MEMMTADSKQPVEAEQQENGDSKVAASDSSKEPLVSGEKNEQRDDAPKDENGNKGSSNSREPVPKKAVKTKKTSSSTTTSNNNNSSSNKTGRFPPDRYPPYPHGRGPYGPGGPQMHPAGPRGPPPPYGYAGHPDHFRGPPPPHYRQMPPMPHQGAHGPYGGHGPGGHYGPPPPSMGGPHFYGHGHYMGGPPMPYHHPNFQGGPPNMPSDNSISSNKSKSSTANKSSKSQASKAGSRKKRTIDGVHDGPPHHQELPSAYAFRRNTSSTSSSTTVTAGNNTSTETDESKRQHELPPLSHPSHGNYEENRRYQHRRDHSGASTTSSLSVGGFSLSSYEGHRHGEAMNIEDNPMLKQSPKRRKGHDSTVLVVDTGSHENRALRRVPSSSSQSLDAAESTRFQKLTMEDTNNKAEITTANSGEDNGASLFLSLSTSPINNDVDATPISKNTKKAENKAESQTKHPPSAFPMHPLSKRKESQAKGQIDRTSNTPTPPLPNGIAENVMMTDEHMLNSHLRNQSFTPLPHMNAAGESNAAADSPSNMGGFGAIAPQLSWSIAGDTPSLGDLAEWEEHAQHAKDDEKIRPSSTTSANSRNLAISPHSFSMWAEEEHARGQKNGDDMRLSILTPHSELGMAEGALSGTTTPLPMFFEQPSSEERENHGGHRSSRKSGETDHIHSMFVSHSGRADKSRGNMHHFWKHDGLPTPINSGQDKHDHGYGMGLPPTPMFAASDFGRDDGFMRSPQHGGRDDFFPSGAMYGHPGSAGHDRVRNLRGRVPPGHHMAPMPLHIPPPNMSSHLPLTSPMGVGHGKAGMWSPHHGGMPPMGSPMHMSPMNMSQSKRKCVPLKPPIPSKFQGDIEKVKTATVPEFTSLVNFPAHMSQKQAVNLPDGMRCCVMCGQACPCSSGNKNKKGGGAKNKNDGSLAPRNSNGQDMLGDKNGYAIIPTQNKGLCTLCDVNVWVVCNTGLEIKWCKGCKNFRPWAAFGDKGLATKCLRCRERQREKYALQKEEKEKARLVAKAGGK